MIYFQRIGWSMAFVAMVAFTAAAPNGGASEPSTFARAQDSQQPNNPTPNTPSGPNNPTPPSGPNNPNPPSGPNNPNPPSGPNNPAPPSGPNSPTPNPN